MNKIRFWAIILLIFGAFVGYFTYSTEHGQTFGNFPFKFGLDLSGGTHLVYQADVSNIPASDIDSSMQALRDTIERRVNIFGVSEPIVQVEKGSLNGQTLHELIVELPGVTDLNKAIATIGSTPTLEFRLEKPDAKNLQLTSSSTVTLDQIYEPSTITGKDLARADVSFDSTTGAPQVSLSFNSDGSTKFADITKNNIGKVLAIILDGTPISTPVIRDQISDGKAVINGNFTPVQAQELVRNLNYGALPVPINLIGSQSIGASLGSDALKASVAAGIMSFIIIALFLILWYRLPGLIAVIALAIYTAVNLAIFKLIPVTLTSAGLAGFILSIGMAVDANILIFERMKEEMKKGHGQEMAMKEGFHRAWLSIRDSNLSSIITSVILYYFATSTLIKGFALVFFIGVVTSMFTAITVSRTFLFAISPKVGKGFSRFLFSNGFSSGYTLENKKLDPKNK